MAWAHNFEFTKKRFIKVYPDLILLPCNLPYYTSVVVEYNEYDDISDIKRDETSCGAIVHARNEIQPHSIVRIQEAIDIVLINIVLLKMLIWVITTRLKSKIHTLLCICFFFAFG